MPGGLGGPAKTAEAWEVASAVALPYGYALAEPWECASAAPYGNGSA